MNWLPRTQRESCYMVRNNKETDYFIFQLYFQCSGHHVSGIQVPLPHNAKLSI